MTTGEYRRAIGNIVRSIREGADFTQEYVAFEMNVGRSTVARWETGESLINVLEWKQYCEVCHKDPVRATLELMLPAVFTEEQRADKTHAVLDYYIHNVAPEHVLQELLYVINGNHGSLPEAVMHLVTADLHTPLYMRHGIAQTISTNYKQAQRMGLDPCPDSIQPDIDMLDAAISAGFDATMDGREGYNVNNAIVK